MLRQSSPAKFQFVDSFRVFRSPRESILLQPPEQGHRERGAFCRRIDGIGSDCAGARYPELSGREKKAQTSSERSPGSTMAQCSRMPSNRIRQSQPYWRDCGLGRDIKTFLAVPFQHIIQENITQKRKKSSFSLEILQKKG